MITGHEDTVDNIPPVKPRIEWYYSSQVVAASIAVGLAAVGGATYLGVVRLSGSDTPVQSRVTERIQAHRTAVKLKPQNSHTSPNAVVIGKMPSTSKPLVTSVKPTMFSKAPATSSARPTVAPATAPVTTAAPPVPSPTSAPATVPPPTSDAPPTVDSTAPSPGPPTSSSPTIVPTSSSPSVVATTSSPPVVFSSTPPATNTTSAPSTPPPS